MTKRLGQIPDTTNVGFCLIKISNVDEITTNHGLTMVDLVIKEVAHRLSNTIRVLNAAGRFDEYTFSVILTDVDKREAKKVAQRIKEKIDSNPINIARGKIPVTVNVAISVSTNKETSTIAISKAQKALDNLAATK